MKVYIWDDRQIRILTMRCPSILSIVRSNSSKQGGVWLLSCIHSLTLPEAQLFSQISSVVVVTLAPFVYLLHSLFFSRCFLSDFAQSMIWDFLCSFRVISSPVQSLLSSPSSRQGYRIISQIDRSSRRRHTVVHLQHFPFVFSRFLLANRVSTPPTRPCRDNLWSCCDVFWGLNMWITLCNTPQDLECSSQAKTWF